MAKCCDNIWLNTIIGTPPDLGGGGEPPVLSDYCVQWTVQPTNICFPCSPADDVNGWFSDICGSSFVLTDFNGIIGNNFYYQNFSSQFWYAQVIRPITNPLLADLGYYAYDCLGFPSGPYPIPADNANCYVQCYTATFDVEDVSTDGFTSLTLQHVDRTVDLAPPPMVPFDNPTAGAQYAAQLIQYALVEPSATVEVIINSSTNVTLNVCTIMNLINGIYGDSGIDKGTFNFTQV